MNRPNGEPEIVRLKDLEKEYHRLSFLVDTGSEHIKKEMEISLQAGELAGVLYGALLKQYKEPNSPETLKSINKLCVRLGFCLMPRTRGFLTEFPYVNGGLFADEDIEIPRLGHEAIDLILHQGSEDFDWSEISPTTFGAVFGSTLNVSKPDFTLEIYEEYAYGVLIKSLRHWLGSCWRQKTKHNIEEENRRLPGLHG